MPVSFRSTIIALLAGLLLAACSPSEADQRKAFIAFLQTDVLSKPGVRLPRPDAEKQKSFGEYAAHYAIIPRFHDRMNESVAKPMQQALAGAMPRSIEEVVNRKADLAAVRAGFVKMREALDAATAEADKERAALKQPEDLAPVYGQAYAKLVTQPVGTFREVFPITDETFGTILALADLIEANKAVIKFSGPQIQISNPAVQAKVQAALNAMNAKQQAMNAAQQKLRSAMYGG
ncbi:DUF3053 family protein [Bosea sp. BK604]|uniref:DUF3053 family protein n=1 Tax=Bosea sp. BK604 TaxID=2512180 RepID=UPI001044CA0A|nr:DUF3053 family protein [Bosea sp. BK604]TCR61245.1 DUF3053 family protein [Bosea sp. BK604]